MAWAILGATSGDVLSYWVGHTFQNELRQLWLFKRFPKLIKKGENLFHRHGMLAVFIGRFTGPARPFVPIIAGMMKMPVKPFLTIDILSAIAWAPVYMLPGIFLGAASLELSPEFTQIVFFSILATVFFIFIGTWLIERYLFLSFLLYLTMLIGLTYSVMHHGVAIQYNDVIASIFQHFHNPLADKILLGLTFLGDGEVLIFLVFSVFAWLIYQRAWNTAGHWFLNSTLTFLGAYFLKHFVNYPRPETIRVIEHNASFPSGHTTASVAIYGFLSVIIARQLPKDTRWVAFTPAIILAVSIAFTRLYFSAHWLSDIAGGVTLGLACLCLSSFSYSHTEAEKLPLKSLLITSALTLLAAWSVFFYNNFTF